MSEADIVTNLFTAIQTVLTIFSLFFAIVSGYVVALYLFLARAPLMLRLVAFGLLSAGLVFLGGTAAVVQRMQEGMFAAWRKLGSPYLDVTDLRNPLPTPLPLQQATGWSQQELGVAIGWGVAVLVYLVLAYMTFLYRWPMPSLDRSDMPRD